MMSKLNTALKLQVVVALLCTTVQLYATPFGNNSDQVTPQWGSAEAVKEIISYNFDSDNFIGWSIKRTNQQRSWHLNNPKKTGVPNFSAINPTSIYSLAIFYDDYNPQDEEITTPFIDIPENGLCSFYACFDGIFTDVGFAQFKLYITPETGSSTEIFDAGEWSLENNHDRPKWVNIKINLDEYANKKVKFTFAYIGEAGDDVFVDDFKIQQEGLGSAEIKEGEKVHFIDESIGQIASYSWSFVGGLPNSSSQQNPIVEYMVAGTYPVTLTLTDSEGGTISKTISDYVVVSGVSPKAAIGFPTTGYHSPHVGLYVAPDSPLAFSDKSTGVPTAWQWRFNGAQPAISNEQNPVVQYPNNGIYDIELLVENAQGSDVVTYTSYLQVGDTATIWNIKPNEANEIGAVALGFFGYYGGSNWLGMLAYAERFEAPSREAVISEVSIYFDKVKVITTDTLITVSIYDEKDGLPNSAMATTSLRADQLLFSATEWRPTIFTFPSLVSVDKPFYVVIEGIPNKEDLETYTTDQIAIAAAPIRSNNEHSTSYHLLENWDSNNRPTGETQWYKNTDQATSFAMAPRFCYTNRVSSIEASSIRDEALLYYIHNGAVHFYDETAIEEVQLYDITGKTVWQTSQKSISINQLPSGYYILQVRKNGKLVQSKIVF